MAPLETLETENCRNRKLANLPFCAYHGGTL